MIEPTPEQLLRELQPLGDIRHKVLTYQLHIEHYVNEIVCLSAHKTLHETLRTHLSFPQKIKILVAQKIINSEQAKILEFINSIRNKMAHKLILSQDEIEKILGGIKLSFKIVYEINGVKTIIDLEKEYSKRFSKIAQFETSATLLVGILYSKFMFATKRVVEQLFYPVFEKKKDGSWQGVIRLMKRVVKRDRNLV